MKVKLTLRPNADKRTKDRIKDHGPIFTLQYSGTSVVGIGEAILVATRKWRGWLPVNQLIIEENPND